MSTTIYFNPLDTACKSVIGGIKEGELLQLNLFLLKNEQKLGQAKVFQLDTPNLDECAFPLENAFLRINRDGEAPELFEMHKTSYGWTISLEIQEIGLYFYSFYIVGVGNVSCGQMELGYISDAINGFLLTVSSQDYKTPNWFKGGVMYQIFPDRFCKEGSMPDIKGRIKREDWGGLPSFRPNERGKILNNDFFGGNFKGIEKKLPYLSSLGVTTLYLNPIFEAASNHRYDTSDYMKVDPFLGTEQDFAELINTAESQGIRLILDGVFNHTGDNSVYFNKYGEYPSIGAYQSKDSPYYSWYSFQEFPDKYSSWWGIDILPEVNESSEDYQNFIFGNDGVLKKWLSFGIGGYRLDVADELPDFFLKGLRKSVKESNPNAIIIGEVWEDASSKIAYSRRREYLQGYELDSVMNYPLKDAIIRYIQTENAWELVDTLRVLINHYPKETLDSLMNILGTHDTARILTVLGGIYCKNKEEMALSSAYLSAEKRKDAIKKLKMAVILQYTMPGVPCIYYGDENGMEGHIDPFCRCCFDWEHQDSELFSFYAKLGEIRKNHKNIFATGTFELLYANGGFIFFKRSIETEDLYIYVNNSSKYELLDLHEKYQSCISNEIYENKLGIKPYAFDIFKKIK